MGTREFLRAGREPGGGGSRSQCPWEVLGASEALLSWGKLPEDLLDEHALKSDAVTLCLAAPAPADLHLLCVPSGY